MIPMKHLMFVVLVLVLVTLRICQAIHFINCPYGYLDRTVDTYKCTCIAFAWNEDEIIFWDNTRRENYIMGRGKGEVTIHFKPSYYDKFDVIRFSCVSGALKVDFMRFFAKAPPVTAEVKPEGFCLKNATTIEVSVTCRMNTSLAYPTDGVLQLLTNSSSSQGGSNNETIEATELVSKPGRYPMTCVASSTVISSLKNKALVEVNAYSHPQFIADGEVVHNDSIMIYVSEDIGCFVDRVPISLNLTCGNETVTTIKSDIVFPVDGASNFISGECECRVEFDHNVHCSSSLSVTVNVSALEALPGSNINAAAMLDIDVWFLTVSMTCAVFQIFYLFTQVDSE